MRRDLTAKRRIDPPKGEKIRIDHACPLFTSGFVQDYSENIWEITDGLRQTSFGFTGGKILIPSGMIDLSTITIRMRMRFFSSEVRIPLSLGEDLWLEVKDLNLRLVGQSKEYFSGEIEREDISLTFRNQKGTVSLFSWDEKIGQSGIIFGSDLSISFSAEEGVYMDDIFLYESALSDAHVKNLGSSSLRQSIQKVKQFF